MLSKIINSTRGRPCSCPAGKECTGCVKKTKTAHHYIEDPKRLSVPIVINHYRHRPPTATLKIVDETKTNHHRIHRPHIKNPFNRFRKKRETSKRDSFCKWYKRRKALRELKKLHEKEVREKQRIAELKREEEFLVQLQKQEERDSRERQKQEERDNRERYKQEEEYYTHKQKQKPEHSRKRKEKTYYKKQKPMKVKKVKQSSTYAKPPATTRYVTVKRFTRDTLTHRFVDWFYRLCCEFYCCLTIIIIIGLAVILLT